MSDAVMVHSQVEAFQRDMGQLRAEIGKVIVGQENIVEGVVTCLLAGGHGLLEGVPGLGKTMLVRTLALAMDLQFSRIQFTADLMPADILGTLMIVGDEGGARRRELSRGPLFAHVVLADEINRAIPKTQSALLQAMQEQSVTIFKTTYPLEPPFMVLATQNPLEMEGTYPLPEAQIDRFMVKLKVELPDRRELRQILERTTGEATPQARAVLGRDRILAMRELVRQVPVEPEVMDYAIRVVQATHGSRPEATDLSRKYVRYGASPRGAQALLMGAKVRALFDGRLNVSRDDIRAMVLPALRHRVILTFEGEAEGVTSDQVLQEILSMLPEQDSARKSGSRDR